MKRLFALFASVAFLTLPLVVPGARMPDAARAAELRVRIPRDLAVVARYGPGESDAKWWTTTIRADGSAVQTVYDKPARRSRLPLRKLKYLVDAIRREKFCSLSREYPIEEKDGPTLILTVTANGRTRRVAVFLPSDKPKNAAVRRFLHVWATVLTLVPSPNRGETPEAYLRWPRRPHRRERL